MASTPRLDPPPAGAEQRPRPGWWSPALTIGAIVVALLALASYFLFDRPLASWVTQHLPDPIKPAASHLTELGYAGWSLGVLAVLFFFCLWRRFQRGAERALIAFVGVASSGLVVDLIKWLAGRSRPKLYFKLGLYGFNSFHAGYDYNSFPSGHAATAAALTTALCFFWPRWRALWITLGAAVASTRILTGSHYLSDVLVGAYLGVAATWFSWALLARTGVPGLPGVRSSASRSADSPLE